MTTNTDTLRNLARAVIDTPQLGNMASRQQQSDHFTRLSANLMAWQSAANPATFLALLDTIDSQRKLLEQARDALAEWGALISHQYTGTREGMSGMTCAAQNGDKTLNAITEHLKAHP